MQLDQSAMDLATLIHKIRSKEIDLQPDFQRGTVWPESKKKRLIDTILRNWYIPAIHIVVNDELDKEEVLDGQQRLQAILDFFLGKFRVDGRIEPLDAEIEKLHGMNFKDLPTKVRSKFKKFSINTVRLRDYSPDEPGELFFRLNQLTALTAAEQRNALIGEPRNQIKKLTGRLEKSIGWALGFSNARMNYDDVLTRLACALEDDNLGLKMTSLSLERRYRSGHPFDRSPINKISKAMNAFRSLIENGVIFKQNKATLFSWLFFLADNSWLTRKDHSSRMLGFYEFFESSRSSEGTPSRSEMANLWGDQSPTERRAFLAAIDIFNDRATSRVNDVSSLILRDLSLNLGLFMYFRIINFKRVFRPQMLGVFDHALFQLAQVSDDVAERALVESDLARAWSTYRA